MSKMANTARNSVVEFPILGSDDPAVRPVKVAPKPSWIYRLSVWYGVIMPNSESPKGWTWNPAVITLMIVIAGGVASFGYYVGQKDAENRHLLERISEIDKKADAVAVKADSADKKATYAMKDADIESGHADPPKKEKK